MTVGAVEGKSLAGSLVRPLVEVDIPDLAAVVAEAFREADGHVPERYRPETVQDRLAASLTSTRPTRSRFLVIEHDGEPVALGGYSRESWSPCVWSLYLAAVRPDLQGRGLGSLIIEQRLKAIRDLHSGVGMVLTSSRRPGSFLRLGFQALRKMPHGPTLMVHEFVGAKAV